MAYPLCCYAPDDAELAHKFYAAYNMGGDVKGLNFKGDPCPAWADLPEGVKQKWRAVAASQKLCSCPT